MDKEKMSSSDSPDRRNRNGIRHTRFLTSFTPWEQQKKIDPPRLT